MARNPLRCAVKVLKPSCPGVDVEGFVEKLVRHLIRATADLFGVDKDYFINSKTIVSLFYNCILGAKICVCVCVYICMLKG